MSGATKTSSPAGERQPLLKKPLDLEKAEKNDKIEVDDAEIVEKDNKILLIAFVMMIVFQLGNRIFGKLQTVSVAPSLINPFH